MFYFQIDNFLRANISLHKINTAVVDSLQEMVDAIHTFNVTTWNLILDKSNLIKGNIKLNVVPFLVTYALIY